MAIIQISKIQHRTGNIDDLPQLSVGELGWATDAKRLFIGNDPDVLGPTPDNTEILTQFSDISAAGANTQVQYNSNGIFGASSAFTFDEVSNVLTLTGNISANNGSFSGTVSIGGNLTVSGNITYYDIINSRTSDPIIEQGGGPNGAPLTGNDGKDRGSLLHYYTTQPVDAFMGWDNSNGEFAFGSNVTNVNDVITFNSLGNVRARTFLGNVVGNVAGNISGNLSVPGASTQVLYNESGLVNASPNFTFTGTALNVIGTINANFFSGDGSNLTNITGANVTGSVANAGYANIAGIAYAVTGGNVSGTVANATYANISGEAYSVSGGNISGQVANALVAGTVYTAAQPNITSVGTLSSLTVSGNVSASNLSGIIRPTSGSGTNGIIFPADPGGGSGDLAKIMYYAASGESTVLELAVTNDADDIIYLNATGGTTVTGTLQATSISTGANITAGGLTGNWTLSSGSRLNATYADLAEFYLGDQKYEAGTVLAFGGRKEVTISTAKNYQKIAGVVTTNPAYVMNIGIEQKGVCIALIGRIPVKVVGKIDKGDLLRASPDHAGVAVNTGDGGIIGRAIQKYNSEEVGLIEVMVGRT